MKPVDILLILILLAVFGAALFILLRAKKKGKKCIGCPHGGKCHGSCDTKNPEFLFPPCETEKNSVE